MPRFTKGNDKGKKTRFKKGQSGNPAGSKPGYKHSKTRLKELLALVINSEDPIDSNTKDGDIAYFIDAAQIKEALEGDTAAYREIMNRLEGTAKETKEHTGKVKFVINRRGKNGNSD